MFHVKHCAALLCAASLAVAGCSSGDSGQPSQQEKAQTLADVTWNASSEADRAAVCQDIETKGIDGFARELTHWEEADAKIMARLFVAKCAARTG